MCRLTNKRLDVIGKKSYNETRSGNSVFGDVERAAKHFSAAIQRPARQPC